MDDYLVIIINENVNANDYKDLMKVNKRLQYIADHIIDDMRYYSLEFTKISEDKEIQGDNTNLFTSNMNRMKISLDAWDELLNPSEVIIQEKESKADNLFGELKQLFEPPINYLGGKLVCSYENKLPSWNINYSKFKGVLVYSLNIGLMHLSCNTKEKNVDLLLQVFDKKFIVTITYKNSALPDNLKKFEKTSMFACNEMLPFLNGIIKYVQCKDDYSKLILEISLIPMNPTAKFSSIEESQDLGSIVDINENNGFSSRGDLSFGKRRRFTITSKKSLKSFGRDLPRHSVFKASNEQSFGNIAPIEIDAGVDIPEEFPEGSLKITLNENLHNSQYDFLDKIEENKLKISLKSVTAIFVGKTELTKKLNVSLKGEGLEDSIIIKCENPTVKIREESKLIVLYVSTYFVSLLSPFLLSAQFVLVIL